MSTVIKVKIRDVQEVIYEGEVDRITSYNEMGRFDIFPQHANFISILRQELTIYMHHEKIKELQVEQAIMKVKQNVAHIYLGIESMILDEESGEKPASPSPQEKDKNSAK